MINGDPNDPIYQVRMLIGDTEESEVGDNVIQFYLQANGNDIYKTSVVVLEVLLRHLSNYVSEQVGEVRVSYEKVYEIKKAILEDLKNNSKYKGGASFVVGGISKSKMQSYRDDSDWNGSSVYSGFYTSEE